MRYFLTLILFFAISSLHAQTIYVDSTAVAGTNNGTSWANAYTTLSSALATAVSGNNILIAKGTYYPTGIKTGTNRDSTFLITAGGIKLYGGYNSTTGIRNIAANTTILSGDIGVAGDSTDNSYHVITIAGAAGADSAIIDGVTITAANANNNVNKTYNAQAVNQCFGAGIAIYNNSSLVVINNCIITKNAATNLASIGGGVINNASNAIFTNTTFNTNNSLSYGGALAGRGNAISTFDNCTFSGNTAGGTNSGGGAIDLSGAKAYVTSSVFNNNIAKNTAGNYGTGGVIQTEAAGDSATFVNCLFTNNIAAGNADDGGGVIADYAGNIILDNCTLYGNTTLTTLKPAANGISVLPGATVSTHNTIIYGTQTAEVFNQGALNVTHSLVKGYASSLPNLDTDPVFINAAGGNFRLTVCSPVINEGLNSSIPTGTVTDLDNNARIFGSAVDMGAYEFQSVALPSNRVLYVDSSVAVSGDGKSWAGALKTLSEALYSARICTNIDSVLVAKGTYYPTGLQSGTNKDSTFLIMRGGVKVYGGYNASTGNRDIVANTTILDGDIGTAGTNTDNSYHVMAIVGLSTSDDSVIVDGFTIQNGNGTAGSNYNYGSTGVARNYGGGITLFHDHNGQKTVVRNCILINNKTLAGAGMSIFDASPAVVYDIFSSNIGIDGGGMQINTTSYPIIGNCIITGNTGIGAGIENSNATPYIVNCTISGNSGGGITNWAAATPIIANCIIYGNSAGLADNAGSLSKVTYSILQNTFAGVGNLNVDPLFTNAPSYTTAPFIGGDYTLQPCSQAINTGRNDSLPAIITIDYARNPRIYNSVVDRGAYEYQSQLPSTIIYVDSSIAVSGNGTSWPQALKTLSDALKEAKNCTTVDTILVAKGTYYSTGIQSGTNRDTTFLIPARGGLKVYGGYNSSTGNRDIAANTTILDGDIGTPGNYADDNHHVVVIAGLSATADSVVVDGFTVEHGYGDSATTFTYNGQGIWRHEGGGIEIWNNANKKIAIRNCTQIDNHAVNGGGMEVIFSDSVIVSACNFLNNPIIQLGAGLYNYSAQKTFINSCTFSGNVTPVYGGGVYSVGSSPVITKTSFSNNTAGQFGGGVFFNSPGTIDSSTFLNNSAVNGGGGICNYQASPVITNTIFTNNTCTQSGGGVYTLSCTSLTVDKCSFTGNSSATATGGGLFISATSSPSVTNSVFSDNKAYINGGGLYTETSASTVINNCSFIRDSTITGSGGGVADNNSSSVITNDTFNSNISSGSSGGGGLYSTASPVISVTGSSFVNNAYTGSTGGGGGFLSTSTRTNIIASYFLNNIAKSSAGTIGSGGGVQFHTSGATTDSIINTVFANNIAGGTADDGGGGFMNYGGTTALTNCTFYGNTTASTVKPDANGISVAAGAIVNVNNNILYGTQSKEIFSVGTLNVTNSLVKGYASAAPNLDTDPLFVNATGGNYHLTTCSPAINAGLNSNVPASITTDIDGNTRIYNSIVDMGAYEFQSVVAPLATKPIASLIQPTCAVTTGTINITSPATGVTYSFDNGATFVTSPDSSGLISGMYELIAQNASGCNSIADTVIITAALAVPSTPTANIIQPTCAVTTGTINITAPATGVTYSFDNGATFGTSLDSSGLISGMYELIVQNASGCNSIADTVTITAPLVVPATPTANIIQPTCTVTTGAINITAPATGVTYSFDNGITFVTSPDSLGLISGMYELIVQNASGCNSIADTVTIASPLIVPSTPTANIIQPTCTVTTGTINITAPATAVTYSFDNGTTFGTSFDSSGLISGTYELIVQNVSGCNSVADTVTITAPLIVPSVPTANIIQPTCAVTTGSINITAPATGVTYSFDNGTTFGSSPDSSGLISGTYELIVQSISGCNSMADTVTITAPLIVPSVPTANIIQPTCTVTTGTINITTPATGVTYSFDNGTSFGTSLNSSGLISGTYELIVQSTSGCNSMADTVTITSPLAIPATPTANIIQPTCVVTTGTINITAPATGVTYSFDNGTTFGTSPDSSGLISGMYELIVQNTSGCNSVADTVTITAPLIVPSVPTANVIQPTCTVITGTINIITPTTGVTYSFDNGTSFGTSLNSSGLISGTYELIVQSTSGCNSMADTVTITSPLVVPPAPTVNITQPTCTVSTGTIQVTNSTTGVVYSFDNGSTFSSSVTSSDLPSDTYQVVMQNISSGCKSVATDAMIDAQPSTPGAPAVSSPVTYCKDASVASLTSYVTGSNLTWYTIIGGTGSSVAPPLSSSSPGTTTYYVSDKTGACEGPVNPIIVTIDPLITPQFSIADSLCLNSEPPVLPATSNNSITGTWNASSISTTIVGSSIYSFYPNDPSQCAIQTDIPIVIKGLPDVSVKDTAVTIKPGTSTLLKGSVAPGAATYYWSPANNIDNINSLSPSIDPTATQSYTLTASLDGCTASAMVDVHVMDQIEIPNTFSPNNDKINDTWNIEALNQFPRADVQVFNRYGQIVFRSAGNYMAAPWRGLYNGNGLPIGTYFYIINLNSSVPGYGEPLSGSISIIR
jgi:gliding motility-associated-like protein